MSRRARGFAVEQGRLASPSAIEPPSHSPQFKPPDSGYLCHLPTPKRTTTHFFFRFHRKFHPWTRGTLFTCTKDRQVGHVWSLLDCNTKQSLNSRNQYFVWIYIRFVSYLTGNTLRLRWKAQSVNAVLGNSHCLLWEQYGTQIIYKDAVRTSQEIHYVSATKTNRLILFKEIIAVYWENNTEHTNIPCSGKLALY
jgi:hypothetical protein